MRWIHFSQRHSFKRRWRIATTTDPTSIKLPSEAVSTMDPLKDPKGHARTKSGVKATRPRSSTKGPLDIDQGPLPSPLSPQQSQRMALLGPARSPGLASPLPRSVAHSPVPRRMTPRPKDFSYLLRPEIYHPLTPLNVPPSFRNSSKQPSPDTSIPDLLARGQYRAAAISATQALTGAGGLAPPDPSDHVLIFELLYTRFACLTLIDATPIAAQEVKTLEDLNSSFYVDEATGLHLVPWELRVLNVRLQAMGFGDPRRAVMSYYELAREARDRLAQATTRHDNSARELWKDRLADLGIRVVGALVEMDDLTGAAHHLASLKDRGDGKMATAKALLWLHLGDVEAARRCMKPGQVDEVVEQTIAALCDMADGEYVAALARWRELKEQSDDEMIGVNMAVCLLYVGRMREGKTLLESFVDSGCSSHTLLFNLTTMYELCTERAKGLKIKLSEKVASMDETPNGWEKTNADFKLQ
ncbi:hypothetical protein B0T24DRAFT_610170 [Lasiosphaeria ovina]|uniref:Trafficking protein particle complex subunit 12 n=1 Tax=Lasiosphaeria ovina TaxID=92902 RepID=A0AAE0KMI6_9PEZI|nr:hypothetical protein B0T24DRAFT_610170 [Lasiosphaeria ovina]